MLKSPVRLMANYWKNITKFTTQIKYEVVTRSETRLPRALSQRKPWWIRIQTAVPAYTHYFGPFDTRLEAVMAQFGYIQDLEQEHAQNIRVAIDQFSPQHLTICNDESGDDLTR